MYSFGSPDASLFPAAPTAPAGDPLFSLSAGENASAAPKQVIRGMGATLNLRARLNTSSNSDRLAARIVDVFSSRMIRRSPVIKSVSYRL
jgi:hypothetical protein